MRFGEFDRGFRFKRSSFTVSTLLERMEDERILVAPDFIYSKPWSKSSKSTFIESMLLGMPTSDVWCEEDNYGRVTVLDGTQRIICINEFFHNNLQLRDLNLMPELNGCFFSDLPYRYASIFTHRVELELTTISYDTHPELKFEFFKRINSDSYRFPVQSARNYAFREHFYFIQDLQRQCSRYISMDKNTYRLLKTSRLNHRKASSFDEFFLFLCALVLEYRGQLFLETDYEEFLDAAAVHLHFKNDNPMIMIEVMDVLARIKSFFNRRILFNPQAVISSGWEASVSDEDEGEDFIHLNIDQIASLFISVMKNSHIDSNTIQNALDVDHPHSSRRFHRRFFNKSTKK